MTHDSLSNDANEREKSSQGRTEPSLQPSWRANADHLTHEEPEIEAARVDQQPLPNVAVAAEVHASHAAGFIEMGKRSFQAFTAEPQQSLTARASNATPIPVHRVARVGVLLPVPSPPIGFRDVAADAHSFEID